MSELRHLLPGERFPPNSERPFQVETFIQGVEYGFVVDVNHSLQELYAVVLPFWVVVVRLKLNSSQQAIFECLKCIARENESTNEILVLVLSIVLGIVHIPQHLQSTRSHGYADPIHQLSAGSYLSNNAYL